MYNKAKRILTGIFLSAMPFASVTAQPAMPQGYAYLGATEGSVCTEDKTRTINYKVDYAVVEPEMSVQGLDVEGFKKKYYADITTRMQTAWITVAGRYTAEQLKNDSLALYQIQIDVNKKQRALAVSFKKETGITLATKTAVVSVKQGCNINL